jgi:hypothetical protein
MFSSECLGTSFKSSCGILSGALSLVVLALMFTFPLHAANAGDGAGQASPAPAPAPDVIVFSNGDQLTGKLLHAVNGTVTFHSDILGDVSVTWDKIKSLRSAQKFAVIQQGQQVSRKTLDSQIVQGTVAVDNQQVEVTPAPGGTPKEIPAKNAQYLVDEDTYMKVIHGRTGFLHGWSGQATFGATEVEATQNSSTFTTAVAATRTVPNVAWLSPSSRTILGFNSAYGSLSQPNQPTTKTNIIHGAVEEDWYLTPRFYALATATFDHDYSQGLDLQQIYGGGFGYTVVKTAKQELDLKTDLHFERQNFGFTPGILPPVVTPSKNLIGADFGDTYSLKLPHGMLFNQGAVITPAFNQSDAWSALGTAGLAFPVYKHFSFSVGVLDNFLNDPAVGSKKNSFQYTAGITYAFQ